MAKAKIKKNYGLKGFLSKKSNVVSTVIVVVLVVVGGFVYYRSAKKSNAVLFTSYPGCSGAPTLRQGSTGACVAALQTYINLHNMYCYGFATLAVDGSFGPKTTIGVKYHQTRAHLVVDGIAGSQTWSNLLLSSGAPGIQVGQCTNPLGGK